MAKNVTKRIPLQRRRPSEPTPYMPAMPPVYLIERAANWLRDWRARRRSERLQATENRQLINLRSRQKNDNK